MSASMNVAPLPSASSVLPPATACDCHAHIMGPFDRFPLPNKPGYMPPLAPVEISSHCWTFCDSGAA